MGMRIPTITNDDKPAKIRHHASTESATTDAAEHSRLGAPTKLGSSLSKEETAFNMGTAIKMSSSTDAKIEHSN